MVARTAKFMGVAYSTGSPVALEVEYNNTIIYSGTVSTITQDPLPLLQPTDVDAIELFTFETNTDTTGEFPTRITVTGGTLFFNHIWMNYTGNHITEPDPNNPTKTIIVPVPPVDFFSDPNTNSVETDGLKNTAKNGVAWDWRVNVGDLLGDWSYPVYRDEIFTFDFYVDPADVVLDPYTP